MSQILEFFTVKYRELLLSSYVSIGVGMGMGVTLCSYTSKVFYVMGKALSGEQSCTRSGLVECGLKYL